MKALATIGPDYDSSEEIVDVLEGTIAQGFFMCDSPRGLLVIHRDKLKPVPPYAQAQIQTQSQESQPSVRPIPAVVALAAEAHAAATTGGS